MEIKDIKSNLNMSNLYFKECCVKRNYKISDAELKADLKKHIEKKGEHTYEVNLKLTIDNEDLKILVIASAEFTYQADSYEREESIVHNNTVAIMFPFVRSHVTLMTSQPGMTPIVLPAINVTKFK